MINQIVDRELDWDDTISNDTPDFVTLEAGEYDFTVKFIEKARHEPNPSNPDPKKLPACNMVVASLELTDGIKATTIKEKFRLHSRCEGFLCAFFTSIGLREKGEPLVMKWNEVAGATGRCKITKTAGKKDPSIFFNNVKKFLEPSTSSYQQDDF